MFNVPFRVGRCQVVNVACRLLYTSIFSRSMFALCLVLSVQVNGVKSPRRTWTMRILVSIPRLLTLCWTMVDALDMPTMDSYAYWYTVQDGRQMRHSLVAVWFLSSPPIVRSPPLLDGIIFSWFWDPSFPSHPYTCQDQTPYRVIP